jgi:hypothetical protein
MEGEGERREARWSGDKEKDIEWRGEWTKKKN